MSFDLQLVGRRALVTAGTKGTGAAVVQTLIEAGVKVVTTARSVPDDSPKGVHFIAADITTAEGCATVAKGVIDHLRGVDIIVNVLGGSSAPPGGFAALSDDDWFKELNLNLMPAVRLDRALLPSMIEQGSASSFTSHRSGTYCRCRNPRRPMIVHSFSPARIWFEDFTTFSKPSRSRS